jgi:hypothetical protein
MSKPIDYSKFDHIGDSDSESESGTCDSAAQNSSNEETSSSFQTQQAQAQSTQMSIPITKTTQEPGTGRYVFSCNGQKVYAWDQNLDEVNVYIPAPPNLPASAFDISIQPQALQVKIRSHDKFFIDEKTFSKVDKSESSWYLDEDEGEIHIVMIKAHRGLVWDSVLMGNDGIASQGTVDPLTQEAIRKSMMLERFQEENPGFDFRDAEFNGNVPEPREFLGGVKYR